MVLQVNSAIYCSFLNFNTSLNVLNAVCICQGALRYLSNVRQISEAGEREDDEYYSFQIKCFLCHTLTIV